MENEISPLSVLKQYVQGPASQKDGSTEQVMLKGERTSPIRGLIVQEGGFKMDGDTEVCGRESISLMDVLVTGTVYLADPDKLSLTAEKQRKQNKNRVLLDFTFVGFNCDFMSTQLKKKQGLKIYSYHKPPLSYHGLPSAELHCL